MDGEDDRLDVVAEAIPRLEALHARDMLSDAGIRCLLQPDQGIDLGRPTSVLVARSRAAFARRLLADARAGAPWTADESPAGLLAPINEHLEALRDLVDELSRRLAEDPAAEGK